MIATERAEAIFPHPERAEAIFPHPFPYLWQTTIPANFLLMTHFLLTNVSAATWTPCSEDTSTTFFQAFGTKFKSYMVPRMPAVKAWKLSKEFNLQKYSTQRLEKKTSYPKNKLVHVSVFPTRPHATFPTDVQHEIRFVTKGFKTEWT
jgi:hypothetical protein